MRFNKKLFITIGVCSLLGSYLSSSFVHWEFNPGLWTEQHRVLAAFLHSCGVALGAFLAFND